MHVKLAIWETPSDYAGYDPVGHILVASQHRDSDALTRSNYRVAMRRLLEAAGLEQLPGDGDEDESAPVYDWRASHWAVGWVDYLMVRPDAPEAVRAEAQAIADELADYPILDEDDYSGLEYDEVAEYWASCSVRHRAETIRDSGSTASLFAARRAELPEEDCDSSLYDYLLGY